MAARENFNTGLYARQLENITKGIQNDMGNTTFYGKKSSEGCTWMEENNGK